MSPRWANSTWTCSRRTDSPPYLHDGSVIAARDTTIPQPVGPMLDQVNALVQSIPKTKLGQLLDETFQGFNGSGYDLGSLIDSSQRLSRDANSVVDRTRALTEDTGPLLDTQARPPIRSGRGHGASPAFRMYWWTTIPTSAPSCKTVLRLRTKRRGFLNKSNRRCRCCWPT